MTTVAAVPARRGLGMSATDGQPGPAENSWGTYPTEQRQTELEEMLHAWEMESSHGARLGPFDREALSGADAFGVAIHAFSDTDKAEAKHLLDAPFSYMLGDSGLPVEGGGLVQQHLKDVSLAGAHFLKKAILTKAYLKKADLRGVDLEEADLRGVDLEGASLRGANLQKAKLRGANLRKADLVDANLCGADVTMADLQEANLFKADFREANFYKADLQGASFVEAKLAGANLSHAVFGMRTDLGGAKLGDQDLGFVSVADTIWNDVILASIDWSGLFRKHWWLPLSGGKLGDDRRDPRTSARAHRQLALALRSQGLNAEAAELDYRAHIRASRDLWSKKRYLAALFSWLACAVFGYGYRLGRCFALYAGVVLLFSIIYHLVPYGYNVRHTSLCLPWWPQAVILSFNSFHGRGFLPSDVTESVAQGAWAASEAVIGLLIEVTLIATFTQRVFR